NNELSGSEKLAILKYRSNNRSFDDVIIVNQSGIGKNKNGENVDISKSAYFDLIKQSTDRVVIKPKEDGGLDHDIIMYSMPYEKNGESQGFIIGISKTKGLIEKLPMSIYEDRGDSYIVDKKGDILFTKNETLINKSIYNVMNIQKIKDKSENLATYNLIKQNGAFKRKIDGKNVLVGFSKIPNTEDWYVVNSVPEDDILKGAVQNIEMVFVLILTTIIVFIIVASYLMKNQKILRRVAFLDKLTKISNYDKFILDAKEFIIKRKNKRCVLICFDIEKFKIINDIYGVKAGDEVLKIVSRNLKKYFKGIGIYGRLEQDVFGLVIECNNEKQELQKVINIIKNEIANIKECKLLDEHFYIDICVGMYIVENRNTDIYRIIDNANMARYKCKESILKDAVLFDENMRKENKKKKKLEKDLYHSIDNNELSIYYQPKYNINSGEIVGAEALIRWNHPTLGMISPLEFIPIAEENKFINNIGKWVFKEVCKNLRQFMYEGIEVVPIAINISRVELYQKDLTKYFEKQLKIYDINPSLVEIEITETTALNNILFINSRLNQIKSLGIKVAMDDFGTGNSNLSSLKDVPIDVLKLDRSLLKDIEENKKSQIMVSSIINLSKNLNLSTVCEGVENINQVEMIKQTGCEIVQGYVFSKPIECKQFKNILNSNSLKQHNKIH
ncbi:MAG: bifunctional diguanylate cyclase/phosphodiesterase, partial [Peptostreptococcaceae bacterium]